MDAKTCMVLHENIKKALEKQGFLCYTVTMTANR